MFPPWPPSPGNFWSAGIMLRCYEPQSLFDLIGKEELHLLLGGVCADIRLPVMVVNKDGETVHRPGGIAGWPQLCRFCQELREDEKIREKCRESEREVGLHVINGKPRESLGGPCHMYLVLRRTLCFGWARHCCEPTEAQSKPLLDGPRSYRGGLDP